ncbi:UDP-N-acetylmuramoylalanyl-D-glutamyl-2, 6-diaminopimelate--D-alanyl-D-alanine ligase [Pseudoxanthomonas jiangsuensis]|uniref:UDP-N-acetylmuramoyl-tripeptide--D-alanyl-D- alanine ligase n=1 Tax=Pseudoxanthomonas jiangsuensis TaxID=619688 RepID=UPI00139194F3|nr:UDP-N-acetylmuramoyl-tripeptide--D-alanyl-D-alanine ligase [Pseudoxanthomonas jiangsuensis]KAF1697865.1 UDP-N-acetylmuramoylalanyl-D-glutamyl-2, 6-diaminopimelate--D-alanyl-D-alanine ligase [Pseudoxanthomonas jiangsuensis]
MNRLPLSLIAHWGGGELHGEDVPVDAITQDTRQLAAGSLYVALRGERFDGHDFAADALARGASALLVERRLELDAPQVLVADSERALARIAAGIQRDRAAKVVAITGSNGKTSVKTLALAVLRRAGRAYANPGNRNNEIGLPLAVIDAPEDAQFAIYEMGAGKPGDIAYLTAIAAPDVALVNNVAAAHLERMGSLLGVAETKGAIYAALGEGGTAVVNADDAFGAWFEQQVIRAGDSGRKVLRFGLDASAEVTAREIVATAQGSSFVLVSPQGEARVELALPGRHNVRNALAAACIGLACGLSPQDIAAGLGDARPVAGRQVAHALPGGAVLIDDSYNANPGSVAAAIEALAASGDEAWLVLGDMRELGPEAEALHADAGRRARESRIGRLYALGPLSAAAARAFGDGGRHFHSHEALAAALAADLRGRAPVDVAGGAGHPLRVLVKGSRGSAMDRIVTALLAQGDTSDVA